MFIYIYIYNMYMYIWYMYICIYVYMYIHVQGRFRACQKTPRSIRPPAPSPTTGCSCMTWHWGRSVGRGGCRRSKTLNWLPSPAASAGWLSLTEDVIEVDIE